MDFKNLLLNINDNYAIITINRPQQLNALNKETITELIDIVEFLEKNENVVSVIITGAGEKSFVAGADIKEMKDLQTKEAYFFSKLGQKLGYLIESSQKIYIAAVNGYALGGGCELAMICDLIYASKKAKFGQPEINLGIIPGFGGTQRLARIVGLNKAKELILTGDIINSEEALKIGLVNKVFEENLVDECIKIAKTLATKSPTALSVAKQTLNKGINIPVEQGTELESMGFSLLFGTQNQKDGMEAFLKK